MVEQLVAHKTHNLEAAGSSPAYAPDRAEMVSSHRQDGWAKAHPKSFKMKQEIINGTRAEIYPLYYKLIGFILNTKFDKVVITDREIDILCRIAMLSPMGLVTKKTRAAVRRGIYKMSAQNLSNFLSRMQEKGLIIEEAEGLRIHPKIIPSQDNVFKITLNVRED